MERDILNELHRQEMFRKRLRNLRESQLRALVQEAL